MKNLLFKSFFFCLLAGVLIGCDEKKPVTEEPKDFSLELKTVAADYVEVAVSAPSELEMAYVVSEKPQGLSAPILFVTGTTLTVSPDEVIKITDGIVQNTTYHMYAAAKLDAKNYSELIHLEFTT